MASFERFLPTRQELCGRHVEPISFCEVCGDPMESIKHVLLDCMVAKLFWEHTKLAYRVKIPALNVVTWSTDLISNIYVQDMIKLLFCMVCGCYGRCVISEGMVSSPCQFTRQ